MKTTLDLDDHILTRAKREAAETGTTLKSFVEDALRARLFPRVSKESPQFSLDLPVVAGTAPPAIDIMDRQALYDFLDSNE